MTFCKVASVDDLWSGEIKGFLVQGRPVLLARVAEEVYAYEDRCAHLGLPLSRGTLAGGVLTCCAHEWQYDIATGRGVNPASACLRPFPIKIEARQIFVDIPRVDREIEMDDRRALVQKYDLVGPVLEASEKARVVIAAIRQLNPKATIQDRGSYFRVLAPGRCRVTRAAVEAALGSSFHPPTELEQMMPSFKGVYSVTEEEAVWSFNPGK